MIGGNDVIEIRELRAGETERLVALFDAVLPGFTASLPGDVDGPGSFLHEPATFVLGAYFDETPVGLAWGLQMRSPSGRLTTYVHELDVREAWRRRGQDRGGRRTKAKPAGGLVTRPCAGASHS